MTKEKFYEIKEGFEYLFPCDGDVNAACDFVQRLLEAEADYIKETEPYATNTIQKLEVAAYEVMSLGTIVLEFE